MANAEVPAMHRDFAGWYSVVSLGEDPGRRQARWEGVCEVVENADRDAVENLLRLAHRSRHAVASAAQAIREAFRASDETFEPSGNDRELQLLAGACLVVLMETDADVGPAAALSSSTTALGGARGPDLPMDLSAVAEREIVRWGDANRKRPSLAEVTVSGEVPRLSFEKAGAKVMAQPSWEAVGEAFEVAASTAHQAMKRTAKVQEKALGAMRDFIRVQDEELQMLWWLIGGHSSICDSAFDDVPADARPLVLAKELADSTEFLPGPPSVKGILSRAGLTQRGRLRVSEAVNAADTEWLQQLMGEAQPSPVTTPLHEAIRRQLETGAGEAWIAGWAASTELDPAQSMSALALGELFYRERLLLEFE